MYQSCLGPGSSSAEVRWPLYGYLDPEGRVDGLHDHVTSLTDQNPPDPDHPSEDWFSQGLETFAMDQGRTVTFTPNRGTTGVGGQMCEGSASSQ